MDESISTTTDVIELLVVDNEPDFLETIAERLEQRGFRVTKAISGFEAVQAAEEGKFDLALIDLRMPGMDGIELLRNLKLGHKYLEVIILTGYGTIESAVECTKLGAFDYLSKSCDIDEVLHKLKEAYAARLKKKFRENEERYSAILKTLGENDPLSIWYETREEMRHKPSILTIFRQLRKLDDDEK
jgi:DNA-binding NtrC family response regulator